MAYAANSLNCYANFSRDSAEAQARAHSLPDADSGVFADIAQFWRRFVCYVARCGGDGREIGVGDADVARAEVAPRKTFYHAAYSRERFSAAQIVVQHHNRFGAAA